MPFYYFVDGISGFTLGGEFVDGSRIPLKGQYFVRTTHRLPDGRTVFWINPFRDKK